jgi:hypothetical protein
MDNASIFIASIATVLISVFCWWAIRTIIEFTTPKTWETNHTASPTNTAAPPLKSLNKAVTSNNLVEALDTIPRRYQCNALPTVVSRIKSSASCETNTTNINLKPVPNINNSVGPSIRPTSSSLNLLDSKERLNPQVVSTNTVSNSDVKNINNTSSSQSKTAESSSIDWWQVAKGFGAAAATVYYALQSDSNNSSTRNSRKAHERNQNNTTSNDSTHNYSRPSSQSTEIPSYLQSQNHIVNESSIELKEKKSKRFIPLAKINYTHDSISPTFTSIATPLTNTIQHLKTISVLKKDNNEYFLYDEVIDDLITVYVDEFDDSCWCIEGNRRLYCIKEATKTLSSKVVIPVNIMSGPAAKAIYNKRSNKFSADTQSVKVRGSAA